MFQKSFCLNRIFGRSLAVFALIAALLAGPVFAQERRLALVVGNAAYEHVPGLKTPIDDAQEMSKALRDLGFEVTVLTDVGSAVFQAVLGTFADQAQDAETVLFYYSGHAFQMNGVNHLVPVSARLADPNTISAETWALDEIAQRLKGDTGQLLIFLDACRDNPLPDSMAEAGGTSAGLAQYDGGAGTFVSFATAPGQLAWDQAEGSQNSPFTTALLARMVSPGQSLSDLMISVRNDVDVVTGGKQTPWEQSSLRSQFYFVPDKVQVAAATALPEFEVVDEGGLDLSDETLFASAEAAAIQGVDGAGKLRLGPVTSKTRSLAVLNAVDAGNTTRISGQDAGSVAATAPKVPPAAELPRAIQGELTRIGCYAMAVDGDWGNGSRNAMRTYYKAKKLDDGDVEPTEAVFLALSAEPEKTCAEPAAVVAKKAPAKAAAPAKKKSTTSKKAATTKKAAPAPAKKSGVTCKFVVVAVVCN